MARRAVLVGIDDYRGISDLRGCVNDVSNTVIRVVTDSRATKAGEEDGLKQVKLLDGMRGDPIHHMRHSNGQLSRKELLSRIRASLRHGGYSQVPQLETEATVRAARALTAPERKAKK